MTEPDRIAWLLLGIVVGLLAIAWLMRQIRFSLSVLHDAGGKRQAAGLSSSLQLHESLSVLVRCVLEDQIELSEACIRIKVLLDNFDPSLHRDEQLSIFWDMYDRMAHMPTHEARKATNKRFVSKLDSQRFELERKHREEILAAARYLQKYLATAAMSVAD
jgi:hypothetical protein